MQTSRVGVGSDWQQFIKLAQDARMRNNGLSDTAAKPVSSVNKTQAAAMPRAAFPEVNTTVSAKSGYYKTSFPAQVPVRILGGKFDGWA